MPKTKEHFKKIGSSFTTIIIILIIFFIVLNIYKSITNNYSINQQINQLNSEIEDIKKQNHNLENLIAYYGTDTYKELELRKKLGMQKSNEKVYLFPENRDNNKNTSSQTQTPTYNNQTNNQPYTPNYIKWYQYIFGK